MVSSNPQSYHSGIEMTVARSLMVSVVSLNRTIVELKCNLIYIKWDSAVPLNRTIVELKSRYSKSPSPASAPSIVP